MIKSLILLSSALLTAWSTPHAYADALSINKYINQPAKHHPSGSNINLIYSDEKSKLGIRYLSNLNNDHIITSDLKNTYTDASAISGISFFSTTTFAKSSIYIEIISALKTYSASDLNNATTDEDPRTFNLETGIETSDLLFAIGYQTAKKTHNSKLPKKRYIAAYSMDLKKDTSLAFEITLDKDYAVIYGGTGNRYVNLTAQLAVVF